jgi:hypothetical protein
LQTKDRSRASATGEHADAPHLVALLRARRAAEEGDELAAPHASALRAHGQ